MANKQLNAVITIGGTITGALKNALGTTRTKLQEIGGAIRQLEREQKMLSNSIQTFGSMGKNVDGLRARYAAVTAEIEKARRAQERMTAAARGMDAGRSMMGNAATTFGAVTAAAATAFVPVVQAAKFEKAMLGVAKQVEGARDENGKLTATYYEMARQVQLLGREIPIATNDLAEMVAAGARMGVAKDELIGFTRTAAMMASAFDLPAAELADQMGKIAGLFKIPIPNIGELADTINYLDDNAISKGQDIIDFLTRTGGVAGSVKVTGKEMAALGSTLLTLGERSETASTATNALFQKLAAADKGTKKFKAAMEEIGLSTAQVQKGMQVDAQGTILQVIEAVNKLPAEKRLGVLVELVGLEHSDTVAKLAGNVEEYRRQIEMANSQQAKGSMGREFSAQLATTNAQWEIAKNRVSELGVNIGAVLLPAVNQVLAVFGAATSAVADFAREHPVLVGNITTVAGTILGSIAAWSALKFGIGAVTFAFNALKLAMATNPIGLLLVALTTAAVLIYKNWEPLKEFFSGLWNGISTAANTALEAVKGYFTGVFNDIKATATAAIDWVIGKIQALGNAWDKTKAFFGFGPDEAPKPAAGAPTTPQPPRVPPMATAPGAAGTVTNNNTNTINITQQPGQNSKALADEVARQLAERQRVQNRGRLFDPAMGY